MAAMTRTDQVAAPIRLDPALPAVAADRRGSRIRWECSDVHWRLAAELIVFQMRTADLDDRGASC